MLITVEDYEKITGTTLADNEKARVETLLGIAISQIENVIGYKLEVEELTENYDYNKYIYLNKRPVVEVKEISIDKEYKHRRNYIEIVKFKHCPCMLVNDFVNSMDEESGKYKSYKIDDISYTFVDFVTNKREKIENVARRIYGWNNLSIRRVGKVG